jgi:hypothetical protein
MVTFGRLEFDELACAAFAPEALVLGLLEELPQAATATARVTAVAATPSLRGNFIVVSSLVGCRSVTNEV